MRVAAIRYSKLTGKVLPHQRQNRNALDRQERRDRRIGFVEALCRQAGEARGLNALPVPTTEVVLLIRGYRCRYTHGSPCPKGKVMTSTVTAHIPY